jgi:hypothetical protein
VAAQTVALSWGGDTDRSTFPPHVAEILRDAARDQGDPLYHLLFRTRSTDG